MNLSSKDYKKVLEIIDIIYSRQDRNKMFSEVCKKMESLVGITTSVFFRMDSESREFQLCDHSLFNFPIEYLYLFLNHYNFVNPLFIEQNKHKWAKVPENKVMSINDIIPDTRLAETEYSCDFQSLFPIFYEMGCMLGCQGDPIGIVGFHRPRQDGKFTGRDKAIVNILFPHLARSIHTRDLLEDKAASSDIGVIEIGENGQVLKMNDAANYALVGKTVRQIPDPGFNSAPSFFQNSPFVYKVRTIKLRMSSPAKIILLEPLPDRYNLRSMLKSYALTRRQEEIAIFAIRGLPNNNIAERLFISTQTVKDHLYDIYGKIGVHNRSEFTAKVLELNDDGARLRENYRQ